MIFHLSAASLVLSHVIVYVLVVLSGKSELNFSLRDSIAVFTEEIVIKSLVEKLLNVFFEKFLFAEKSQREMFAPLAQNFN